MAKTAKLLKDNLDGFAGHAALYELSEPVEYDKLWGDEDTPVKKTKFVVVSAASIMGAETYIFPASGDGKVIDWGELDGSFRGGLDHAEALRGAGFEIE